MIRTFHRLAIVLAVLAAAFTSAAPANADQNSGYGVPTPTASADYFDPHDQNHGDQPKLGGWGHEFGEFGYRMAAPTTPPPGFAAAAADIPCPANVVCTYSEANFHGAMYYYSGLGSCTTIGPDWSGRISSIINNKTLPIRVHYNTGCSTNIFNTTIDNPPNPNKASFQYSQLNDHVRSLSYA